MRKSVMVLIGVAACAPIAALASLFAAAHFSAMDRLTLALPMSVRVPVAQIAMGKVGYGKDSTQKIDRVIKIDPENPDAWSRRCNAFDYDPAVGLAHCQKALSLQYTEDNFNGLGLAQEGLKDYCAAEDSFTRANTLVNARDGYILRNMGRAALECGHAASSVAIFEVAEEADAKDVEDDDDKDDLVLDREWLVLANQANHDPKAAAAACAKAHPDWKSCHCTFDGTGLKCANAP